MSDEVFEVVTPFGDVAELGQGYINRADGERMLVPLPEAIEPGEGVRFIVHLADGTPAFAGAGRCIQVSDQGEGADPDERYETLLDSLAFDERSRPVYDYIVAVRQAVYAAGGPGAQAMDDAGVAGAQAAEAEDAAAEEAAAEEAEAAELAAAEGGDAGAEAVEYEAAPTEETLEAEASEPAQSEEEPAAAEAEGEAYAVEASVESVGVAYAEVQEGVADDDAYGGDPDEEATAFVAREDMIIALSPHSEVPAALEAKYAAQAEYVPEPEPVRAAEPEPEPELEAAPFVVEPLPTGMLQRPGIAAHWQPAPPRLPTPSRRSGLFRYASGSLPVPAQPPRPAIDPRLRVTPAPAPRA